MSLRKTSGEWFEKEKTESEKQRDKEALRKFHSLMRYGRAYGCRCGKIFQQPIRSQHVADLLLESHRKAVEEAQEESRKGISHYGD